MDKWRECFRRGIAPLLSTAGLEALRKALVADDPRLLQGCTTTPPPLAVVRDWPVEASCFITYAGWQGGAGIVTTVEQAEEYFAGVCFDCDQALGEPAYVRHFLNFWDEMPRPDVLRALLPEVNREIARRYAQELQGESA